MRLAILFLSLLGLFGLATLAGCGGMTTAGNEQICLDDSGDCVASRTAAFKELVADKQHAWVNRPASRSLHASGIRMFAYKATKAQLTCAQLTAGINEASSVRGALAGPMNGVSADRISQAKALAEETRTELQKVRTSKRCA